MCIGPRYIELFLHSTDESGGPQGGGGAVGGMKYGQQQTQQGWGDNRAQVGDMAYIRDCGMTDHVVEIFYRRKSSLCVV